MTAGFANSRRAEEFDALLSGDPSFGADSEFAELLELVATMRSLPEVTARPAYVAELRGQLMTAAATQQVRVVDDAVVARLTPRQRTNTRRERRVATFLGGFAVASATASMAVASQGALPGDVLYPIKRAIENAQTNLEGDQTQRAATVLDHAEQRLSEVKELNQGGSDADELAGALQDLTEQANQAGTLAIDNYQTDGDTTGITELRGFIASGLTDLTAMSDSVPAGARGALVTASQTLRQIDTAAWQACPVCGDDPANLPELAALASLDELLTGDGESITDLGKRAEEQAAATPKSKPAKPAHRPAGDDDGATSDDDDIDAPISPAPAPVPKKPVEDTEGPIEKGVKGATDGDPDTSSGSNIVDGVTGLLDNLTDPLLP